MARYLIDANLPRHAGVWSGSDCEFVIEIDPALTDIDIWKYAGEHGLTIVSKDADFANLVLADDNGPSVIRMRIGNMKFRDLDAFLARTWKDICDLSGHAIASFKCMRIELRP